MTHDDIREKLFALYDGPLTEQERVLVDGHLSQCADCRKTVEDHKKISRVLFTLPAFSEASEDRVVRNVLSRIQAFEPFKPWTWKNLLRWYLPMAGTLAAAAWVFFAVLPDTPGIGSQPVVDAFNPEAPIESYSTLNQVAAASPTDHLAQNIMTVSLNY